MAEWKDRMDSSIGCDAICAGCDQRYGDHYGMRCDDPDSDSERVFIASQAEPPVAPKGAE